MVKMEFGTFSFGKDYAALSKALIAAKAAQVSSDITNIIPVSLDSELISSNMHKKTALYDQIEKFEPPESTAYWPIETSDNFGKFTTEATAVSAFDPQKGTYGTTGYVATKLMTYVLDVGLIAQKNARNTLNLMRTEQEIGMLAMRKGLERAMILGHPAGAASDGSETDSNAFSGLRDLVTTNVDNPTPAEAISLDKIDAMMDACIDAGASKDNLIAITDTYTLTKIASLFYNTYNTPIGYQKIQAGIEIEAYRKMPIFVSDYTYSKTSASREFYIVDTDTTKLAQFWDISQLDLGREGLSDKSVMFTMAALAVKKQNRNAIIKKIV